MHTRWKKRRLNCEKQIESVNTDTLTSNCNGNEKYDAIIDEKKNISHLDGILIREVKQRF